MKIAYLGPEGTFTEQAANYFAGTTRQTILSLLPQVSIEDVFEAVENNRADLGVVPFENSIEGAVTTTIDTLIFDSKLFISKLLTLPVEQNLIINGKNAGRKVTKIISHPQALAQCRKFINKHYNGVPIEITNSTAEAVRIVAENGPESNEVIAAIGSQYAADHYSLKVVHKNIQSNKNNSTQFILLTKTNTSLPKMGHSTSIAFSTEDKPGELYKILDIFAIWDLNMTKIMSRPTKNKQGEYVFYVEISNYTSISDVSDALTMIKRKTSFFKNLGSYNMVEI
jgi:prephenate dehydratase